MRRRRFAASCLLSFCAIVPAQGQERATGSLEVARDARFWADGPAAVRVVLERELEHALLAQRREWQASEIAAHGDMASSGLFSPLRPPQRMNDLHCHPDAMTGEAYYYSHSPTLIRSKTSRFAVCPTWIPPKPGGKRGRSHEHAGASLDPVVAAPFPAALVGGLDSAVRLFPNERWFVGQLVRVLTENGNTMRALEALRTCTSSASWCELLTAYVHFLDGEGARADSLFEALAARMSATTQCEWYSVGSLLRAPDSVTYARLSCDDRELLDRTMWWLATPFLSERANLRRAAHFSRLVRNTLVGAVSFDPFYQLASSRGGDAVASARLRYGWADHLVWGGQTMDMRHDMYLGPAAVPPYSAPEYSRLNVATLPPLTVGMTPFTVTDEDYFLGVPANATSESWWPSEFFRHPGGTITRLAHKQHVVLRRDTSALLLVAAEIRGGVIDDLSDRPVSIELLFSPAPDVVRVLQQESVRRGERVFMRGSLERPGIVGLEFLVNAQGMAGARTRFGVAAPSSLRDLGPRACALSEPVLMQASALNGKGVSDAQAGMLGSLELKNPSKIGVLWESYGFDRNDSLAIALRVESSTDFEARQRSGDTGRESDPRTSLAIRWTETNAAAGTAPVTAIVPTLTRQLAVDLSRLPGGDYVLEIMMKKRGCDALHTARSFVIVR